MKTVKELADEMGIEKHVIKHLLSVLGLSDKLTKSGNRYLLDNEQITAIKKAYSERTGTEFTPPMPSIEESEEPTEASAKTSNPPNGFTISEWADNRGLRRKVLELESELSKEKFARNMLQRDFDIYKTQAEKTLADTTKENEQTAAAKQAEYEKALDAKDAQLNAGNEQLDRMTATLAKLAPYFGDPLAEQEKIGFFRRLFKRLAERGNKEKTLKLKTR